MQNLKKKSNFVFRTDLVATCLVIKSGRRLLQVGLSDISYSMSTMTLHIFNPEHDLALACNKEYFTPPAAAQKLYSDLGFIPVLWADDGDAVVVEDQTAALGAWRSLRNQMTENRDFDGAPCRSVEFVTLADISLLHITAVDVWGWDSAIRYKLLRHGVPEELMPGKDAIVSIRELSHRRHAIDLLRHLKGEGMTGEGFVCSNYSDVEHLLSFYHHIVVKAPWSCSGRGIRFLDGSITQHQSGWIKNMLKAQGSVIVEPYYKKVKDFGLEFYSDGAGNVEYCGLSLFDTDNWMYTGSVLASEPYKTNILTDYISSDLIDTVRGAICSHLGSVYSSRYRGVFGVDMMIVEDETERRFLLHPCVEINLRRTMGHAAIAMSPSGGDRHGVMRIENINNHYLLKTNFL